MKFFIVLSMLLLPLVSQAQTTLYFEESQALTRANPTGNPALLSPTATRPLSLVGVTRYRVTLCAQGGATLSGSGSIRLWLYTPKPGLWGYGKVLTVTTSGASCQSWGLVTDVRVGWVHPSTMGVTVSSGTTVTVRVDPDNF